MPTDAKQDNPLVMVCKAIGLPGRVALGCLLAIGFGLLFKNTDATDDVFIRALKMPGKLWMNLLKMTLVPLVFSNCVTAVYSIKAMASSGKLGGTIIAYYTGTTVLAATTGIIFSAMMLIPNVGPIDATTLPDLVAEKFEKKDKLADSRDVFGQFQAIFEGFTPTNVVGSASKGDLLGLISFSVMFGLVLPRAQSIWIPALNELNKAMFRIIEILIIFTPIGVFCLVIEKVILLDIAVIFEYIGIFLATVFAGLAFHNFVTYPAIYVALTRKNPVMVAKNILPAVFTALGTSSSATTLPVTTRCAVESNNVPPELAKFVLSLGAVVNMDGTAIGFPIAVIFLAWTQGIVLGAGEMISMAVVSSLSAMGAAPIPSAGLVLLLTILDSVNVPVNQLFGLIIAVDWIYDRPETMTNIIGDSFAACIMAHYFGDDSVRASKFVMDEQGMPRNTCKSDGHQTITVLPADEKSQDPPMPVPTDKIAADTMCNTEVEIPTNHLQASGATF